MPMCEATVELISRVQRPYLFKVTVTGKPPHNWTRVYEIAASSDTIAAMAGLDKFVKEANHPLAVLGAMV
jgi:hypothetical protein